MISVEYLMRELEPGPLDIEEKIKNSNGKEEIRKYYKGRFLGKGGFASSYEVVSYENKKKYAAKVISKATLTNSQVKEKLITEIKIHKSLINTNIVQFKHYFEDKENVYLLMEMCDNQTLNELLQRRNHLTELEVMCYVVQIIKALKYLHSRKVIHRDLKLGNLFLTDKMELKLGDFGLATRLDSFSQRKNTVCGTPNYVAPEILMGKNGYSIEVDIWSLGIIIYTLIIGVPPFQAEDAKSTYDRIVKNKYSFPNDAVISEAAKSLITDILVLNPEKRPKLIEILSHDFFKQVSSIPKFLPAHTLVSVPSLGYMRQFMSGIEQSGINNKFLNVSNDDSILKEENKDDQKLQISNATDETQLKSDTDFTENSISVIDQSEKFENLNLLSVHREPEYNINEPDTWVKICVDYTSKYGFGYLLSNGSTGVYFNDSTKIILCSKSNVFYYFFRRPGIKQENVEGYTLTEYPKELNGKVTLVQYFKNFLEKKNNAREKIESTTTLSNKVESDDTVTKGKSGMESTITSSSQVEPDDSVTKDESAMKSVTTSSNKVVLDNTQSKDDSVIKSTITSSNQVVLDNTQSKDESVIKSTITSSNQVVLDNTQSKDDSVIKSTITSSNQVVLDNTQSKDESVIKSTITSSNQVVLDNIQTNKEKNKNSIVYVKNFLKTKLAILIRLSNKIVQVCFKDNTEIILSSESRIVTYTNAEKVRKTYFLLTALESNDSHLIEKLKYTKDILSKMINKKSHSKEKKI